MRKLRRRQRGSRIRLIERPAPETSPASDIDIRPWSDADLPLLQALLGDPAMTEHIGGPESPDAIRSRHERYIAMDPTTGEVFAIVIGPDSASAGWVGYWQTTWHGEDIWEAGWSVLPPYQGRGAATAATALMIDRVRTRGTYRHLHAFPSVENASSNAVCRRLGFTLLGEADVEYPKGHMMRSNDWCLDVLGSHEALNTSAGNR